MNKSRELFLLFAYECNQENVEDYTLIYKHTFLNDEPPYKMCSFYGLAYQTDLLKAAEINADEEWSEEESYHFYFIRNRDASKFISLMNNSEKDYLDDLYQTQIEQSYEDNSERLSTRTIEAMCFVEKVKRRPKIKILHQKIQHVNH